MSSVARTGGSAFKSAPYTGQQHGALAAPEARLVAHPRCAIALTPPPGARTTHEDDTTHTMRVQHARTIGHMVAMKRQTTNNNNNISVTGELVRGVAAHYYYY